MTVKLIIDLCVKMSKGQRSRRQLSFTEHSPAAVCALCLNNHSHKSAPRDWKNQHARNYVLSLNVSVDSQVCRPCRDDVTRVLADTTYIPRWRKGGIESVNCYCCVSDCNEPSFSQTSLCSADELRHIKNIQFQTESIPIPTPLCKSHYYLVYDTLQARRRNCRTCGRRLHSGNGRPCPTPNIIQAHLYQHTDFSGDIHESDHVCLTCYRSFLVILKEDQPVSYDDELQSLVESIRQPVTDDIVCLATTKMLIMVGKMLLNNKATLLPTICSEFKTYVNELSTAVDIQKHPEIQLVSSKWILTEILAKYQHHVTYICKVRKYGTLVYRPTSDVHALLSEALCNHVHHQ